jgi:hypothetical protein
MYENIGFGDALGLGNIGNFSRNFYWSSTEGSYYEAWVQGFLNGYQDNSFKVYTYNVRAVRAF